LLLLPLLLLLLMYNPADASTRLALELDQEIQDLAIKMKEHKINSENRDQQCSSDEPVVDLVISAAMTPPYPYGYGAEYVARCACPPSSPLPPSGGAATRLTG
jgi:hypothetical protein